MEILCGGCGKMLTVDETGAASAQCPHCGRVIQLSADAPDESQTVEVLSQEDDLADEFLTKARLSLKKKLLVICGACHQRLTIEQRLAGKVIRCVACGGQIRVPTIGEEEPDIKPVPRATPAEGEDDQSPADVDEPVADDGSERKAIMDLTAALGAAPAGQPASQSDEAKRVFPFAPPPEGSADSSTLPPDQQPVDLGQRSGRRRVFQKKRSPVLVGILAMVAAGLALLYLLNNSHNPPQKPVADKNLTAAGPEQDNAAPPPPPPPPTDTSSGGGTVRPPTFFGLGDPTTNTVTPVTGTTEPVKPPVPAPRGGMAIAAAKLSYLGPDLLPAPAGKAFVELTVQFQGGDGDVKVDPAAVALVDGKERLGPIAFAAPDRALARADRPGAFVIPAGQQHSQRLNFLAGEQFAGGKLEIAGVGQAAVPAVQRFKPEGGAEGSYVEAARFLRLSFDQPVLEQLRRSDKLRLSIGTDGKASINLGSAVLAAQVAPGENGSTSLTLGEGPAAVQCRLRQVEPNRLVLYLSDQPYHQIVYEKQ